MQRVNKAEDTGADAAAGSGFTAFIDYLSTQVQAAPAGFAGSAWYILRASEDCAYIRLQDMWQPLRFLRQMAGAPPLRFGTSGFSPKHVDDSNPARHYMAFVFVGFWLPPLLGVLVLYAWEIAGFLRYRFQWSPNDVTSGKLGLRHGGIIRRYGPTVHPALVAADLAAKDAVRGSPHQT
jgi:hypothetical protein